MLMSALFRYSASASACTCIYSEHFWKGLCIRGDANVEGNTILTPKSLDFILKNEKEEAFTSPSSLLLCTSLVLSILINIVLFPCNSKIVQP